MVGHLYGDICLAIRAESSIIHLFISSSLHLFKEGERGKGGKRRKRRKGERGGKEKEEEKGEKEKEEEKGRE